MNTYMNSTMDAPIAVRVQKRNLPSNALETIIILTGPATGIENKIPAIIPTINRVMILSNILKYKP